MEAKRKYTGHSLLQSPAGTSVAVVKKGSGDGGVCGGGGGGGCGGEGLGWGWGWNWYQGFICTLQHQTKLTWCASRWGDQPTLHVTTLHVTTLHVTTLHVTSPPYM